MNEDAAEIEDLKVKLVTCINDESKMNVHVEIELWSQSFSESHEAKTSI